MVSYDDFKKLDIRIGKILVAEKIEGAEKVLKLTVDIGSEQRQIVAGLAKFYSPEDLVGRLVPILANLEPRMIMGVESQGMLLATGNTEIVLLHPEKEVPPGNIIK